MRFLVAEKERTFVNVQQKTPSLFTHLL